VMVTISCIVANWVMASSGSPLGAYDNPTVMTLPASGQSD
jgi:hypothetical protein